MKFILISRLLVGAGIFALIAGAGAVQAESAAVSHKALTGTYLDFLKMRQALADGKPIAARSATRTVPSVNGTEVLSAARVAGFSGSDGLPLWTFNARSSRDGQTYAGAMVGSSPFTDPESTSVPANIIPVVFHIHSVATAIDPATGAITLAPGNYTANPSARDDVCLSAPNDVPARLLRQSPIFQPTHFVFGGTSVGTTQYIDAMQRANFYNANRKVLDSYHMLFAPVNEIEPLIVDVPADEGVAIDAATFFGGCGTLVLVDIDWFDFELNSRWLPKLAREAGVGPGNLPIFMLYNSVLGGPPTVGLGDCCIGGYHSYGGFPTPTQTYSVADFDTTGLFGVAFANTAVIAHELGEWTNDPFGINLVPAWGGTGQVSGCQDNLEVGDPLTGTVIGPITGSNGFPYLVQELAFFSWFLGAPSIGINGWFSDNGTFTTDAGMPCVIL